MSISIKRAEMLAIERFSSLEYFGELRDTWGAMVDHVEACLARFMQDLPLNYRSRPLPEMPDIVWGERVLPNFRDTFQGLCTGYIKLAHGEIDGLQYAHGPRNDFIGQRDFWAGWMSESEGIRYWELLLSATEMASNICATEGAYWTPFGLSDKIQNLANISGHAYRLNPKIFVASGAKLHQSGIYAPDVQNGCSEFLSTKYEKAPKAIVLVRMGELFHPITGEKYGEEPIHEEKDCVWYLVERASENLDVPVPNPVSQLEIRLAAGETCQVPGYYFAPSCTDSRRYFAKGERMPSFESQYGATIWQRDSRQD